MNVGYARVSTKDQHLDRQLDALKAAGRERIFSEAASGKKGAVRPEWDALMGHLREGDVLVVVEELSRLGRHLGEFAALVDELAARGVGLRILGLGIETSTPTGRLVYQIIGAVAEMERNLLIERTRSGLEAARARGRKGGRRPKYGKKDAENVRKMRAQTDLTMAQIAKALNLSVTTAYRLLAVDGSDG
jgi:DNA invertase Pin-like site-specific DNA recombinase